MEKKDRKKWEKKKINLQGLIYTHANWLLCDLAIEAKISKQVHGLEYIGRDLSKCCRAYRVKGYEMPAGRLGKALRAVGRTGAGVIPSIMVRELEREGGTTGRLIDDWKIDWGHIGVLANTRARDWRIHEPGEMAWVPGRGNVWVPADFREQLYPDLENPADKQDAEPEPVVNPQAWSDINFNRIDKMERAAQTLYIRSNGLNVFNLNDEVDKCISEVRTLVNDWLAVNQSVFPDHPLTKHCLKIVAQTEYSSLSSREGEVNWVRFRSNVNGLNLICGRAMREPVEPKPDEPKSYGLTTVQMQQVVSLRNTLSAFELLVEEPDDGKRVDAGIHSVREANFRWLEANRKDLSDHAITRASKKIGLSNFTEFDSRQKRLYLNEDWDKFKDCVCTMRLACIKAIRTE